MSKNIGIIGVGRIGFNITERLIESGYQVYAHDLMEDKKTMLEEAGAVFLKEAQEILEHTKTIITSLPKDEAFQGAIEGLDFSGSDEVTIIEMSTILPQTLKSIAASHPQVRFIDAPISGGPNEARKGSLNFIISCDEKLYEENKHVFNALGNSDYYVGAEVGDAKVYKLMNNIMTLGNVLVASSAFSLGKNKNLDTQRMYDVLSQTGGKSHHFIKRFPKVINDDYSPLFSNNLGLKDITLAIEWADSENLDTRFLKVIKDYYSEAVDDGLGEEDIVSVIKVF